EPVTPALSPPRRTQEQRRTGTIARLVEATISSLVEVGYAGTSVKEICGRSGVSHGGLFRHFETRLDLIVAATEEVSKRQIILFQERFASQPEGEEVLLTAVRLLRDACREPINAAWYEVLVASRTDEHLRRRVGPAVERFYAEIGTLAARLPGSEDYPPELFETLVFTLVSVFDGEALVRAVHPMPDLEARRLDLAVAVLESHRHQEVRQAPSLEGWSPRQK
ncbi:MAG: TetR/AcrR family transcriptional regulator, partial [Streptosporangiaceae bacterium]